MEEAFTIDRPFLKQFLFSEDKAVIGERIKKDSLVDVYKVSVKNYEHLIINVLMKVKFV